MSIPLHTRLPAQTHGAGGGPRRSVFQSIRESSPSTLFTAPVIYAGLVPIALLDIFATVFQAVCLREYHIAKVRRKGFISFDRHRLPYLNFLEKLNCDYCAYFNGVLAYAREVASRTEQHFCPIRHRRPALGQHPRHDHFVPYGDAEAFEARLPELQAEMRRPAPLP